MAFRVSSSNIGNGFTLSTSVPAGIASGDQILLFGTTNRPDESFTGKWPTGFSNGQTTATGGPDGQTGGWGYKFATGSESGTFTLSNMTNDADWCCGCIVFSGRHASNPPVGSTPATDETGQTTPVSVTANGLTAESGDDLCMLSFPDVEIAGAGLGHTAPTNYTERIDVEQAFSNMGAFTRDNVSAGSTGNITATFTLTTAAAGHIAYLIRCPAAAGGAPPPKRTLMMMGIGR